VKGEGGMRNERWDRVEKVSNDGEGKVGIWRVPDQVSSKPP
jgi:hypothetical protein